MDGHIFVMQTKIRVTFFSGDVHRYDISRFQTKQSTQTLPPINDSNLIYQIISSPIAFYKFNYG